ncbi:MAG: cell surface protein SprA [Bacteroidales bacterium]
MERLFRYEKIFTILLLMVSASVLAKPKIVYRYADNKHTVDKFLFPPDTVTSGDTSRYLSTPYPFQPDKFPYTGDENTNPLFLQLPENIKSEVMYDPETGLYILRHKMGDLEYRPPIYMTLDEYRDYELQNAVDNYWRERSMASGAGSRSGIIPPIYIGGKAFDRIFGGHTVDIRPSGSVELIFQVLGNSRDDPTLDVRQRRQVNFDFQEKIQLNVVAKIGEKIEFKTNYNTEATFDFENKLNLRYEGDEDEILQLLEAGNVNLPLNSTLITGSQSLFGIKSKMKFGRTTVTAIFSEQESETKTISVQGGAQTTEFLLKALDYEENRHFFLAHYFRENYERGLEKLPIVNSNINITKIEVWVTNIGAAVTENRNIIAFNDIGEYNRIFSDKIFPNLNVPPQVGQLPGNFSNTLFQLVDTSKVRNINQINEYLLGKGLIPGEDFDKIELARKLQPTEYTFNSKLGFISLNSRLNSDQTLAVAFQYQVIGGVASDSAVFQVGEFSDEGITGANTLIVKLLKGTYVNIRNPNWDLMMKNVYSLNAFQVNADEFTLNILYSGDESGVPTGYFEDGPYKGQPLIQVFNLDNLNKQLNPPPDAVFDFLDNAATQGGTINSRNGRIYFPVLEPFGSYLRNKLENQGFMELADKYCYDSLYTLTKTGAEQFAEKNKFLISGYYRSQSGSEISLNALNVPRGSVTVTAGGVPLVENVDYTVDYTLGRVRIINEGILNSGAPISIKMESNTLFSIQTKRLMGAHIDYDVSRNFHIGGTILNLHERPLTQKVNYGDDPISNTIWGLDYSYQTESRFITRLVDKLPFISTSAVSNVVVDGEFAHFIPGHSKAVGKEGVSYIDDFEGTKSTIDLRNFTTWNLSSTPQFQQDIFPEGQHFNSLSYGYNRSLLSWYVIDPSVFYDRSSNIRPPNINNEELSNHYVRQVLETEVFPNRDIPQGTPTNIGVLNVAYYPSERGPYNYDAQPSSVSAGINADGSLAVPSSRWGGMMRKIETADFEAANIEYIEFWMMDPFAEGSPNSGTGGELYFNLGDVSEDLLNDGLKSFEHGLPTSENFPENEVTLTPWGRVPNKLDLVQSFSNDPGAREFQDVGYDGLRDIDERIFFSSANTDIETKPYLDIVESVYGSSSQAYLNAFNDPSGDNYRNYRGSELDNDPVYASILNRYKRYTGPDGNSPEGSEGGVYDGNSRKPNMEDVNGDNTLNEGERYYQYRIELKPNKMNVGENYIADVYEAVGIPLANGEKGSVKWYQFKIPVRTPDKVVGSISDFKSIRFMRMFMRQFSEPVVLRFATMDLVRGEWRRYPTSQDLLAPGEYIPTSSSNATTFDISAVNIEENGRRSPIPYVIPPGIEREVNIGTTNLTRLNEQSMVLKVCELSDGDVSAAYKTADFDFRQFKRLKMFVHAEKSRENDVLKYGDLTLFIRLGSDFTQNYYEYEVPLTFTNWYTNDPYAIWPESNELDIDLERLTQFKLRRNEAIADINSGVSLNFPYIAYDGQNKVTVIGSPSISDVKAILIGIRNPKKTEATPDDDGEPKCAEIWVNELRLTNFNKQSGWATTGRIAVNLADLGNLSLTGSYTSPWFSSIDKKITEIPLESFTAFGISTNLALGKFFPEKSGIRVPLHFDYSENHIRPKYNPLDPDLFLDDVLASIENKSEADSIRELTIDYTQRKNINFMNVRKDRIGAQTKPRIYDIENFDLSYSYSQIFHRNADIEADMRKTYMGGLGYNFNLMPKNVKPFEKVGVIANTKSLQLLKDFNFFFLPKMFSFRTNMDRMFNEKKLRNKSFGDVITLPMYDKTWTWNRLYDLKFDLATSLTMNFSANATSFINEMPGPNSLIWDGRLYGVDTIYTPEQKKEQVRQEILGGGTKSRYNQNLGLNYNVPINKIPLLDWVTATAGYQVAYTWTAAPVSIQSETGNNISNNQNYNINGNADLNKLYNKIGFLKNINQPPRQGPQQARGGQAKREDGPEADTLQVKPKVDYAKIAYETLLKIIMSVKKVTVQYSVNQGTAMPGFAPIPQSLGNNWGVNAPGMDFIFGYQPDGPSYFNREGWLTQSASLNTAFSQLFNETMNFRVTIEPFNELKIELTADRTYSNNIQSYFVFDTTENVRDFVENSRMQMGSFTMSYITWGTAFGGSLANEESVYFENMKDYRTDVAQRLAREDPRGIPINDSTGYPNGYGPNSQYVMLPSFLAAYTGKGSDNITLDPFPKIPLPNWRISYTGLAKLPFLQGIFKSITVNHVYRSSYSIGSYTTNVKFIGDTINGKVYPADIAQNKNPLGDFYPIYEFGMVSITEQFSPLINFDMTLQNSLLAKLEMKKSRNLTLSFANNQLTEVTSDEFIVGSGFRFKDVPLTLANLGGAGARTFRSDLNIKADVSIRNNKTVLRGIDTDLNQISAGQKIVSLNTSIDYMFSRTVTFRLFFDKIINNPYLPSQYRNSTTKGGFSLRFSLAQ